jgi:hypothetical protein
MRTVRLFRNRNSLCDGLVAIDDSHSPQPNTAARGEWCASRGNERRVAHAHLDRNWLSRVQPMDGSPHVLCPQAEESFTERRIHEINDGLAIDKQCALAGDSDAELVVAVLIRAEICDVLRAEMPLVQSGVSRRIHVRESNRSGSLWCHPWGSYYEH